MHMIFKGLTSILHEPMYSKFFLFLDWNEGYPVNSEELMRSGRDPWIIMDEDIYDSYQKRSNPGLGIWKKNQDANLMRIGKRSAFNDDMVRNIIFKVTLFVFFKGAVC